MDSFKRSVSFLLVLLLVATTVFSFTANAISADELRIIQGGLEIVKSHYGIVSSIVDNPSIKAKDIPGYRPGMTIGDLPPGEEDRILQEIRQDIISRVYAITHAVVAINEAQRGMTEIKHTLSLFGTNASKELADFIDLFTIYVDSADGLIASLTVVSSNPTGAGSDGRIVNNAVDSALSRLSMMESTLRFMENYVRGLTTGGTAPTPTPSPSPTPPSGNAPSSWAANEVNQAIDARLVPAALRTNYTQAITRAEFCALAVALYESATGNVITNRQTFSDTNDVNVQMMAAIGVVNGVGNNMFNPNGSLTREQAATMLARLAEAIGKPLTKRAATFSDNGNISSWAIEAVGQIQAAGIMQGMGNNLFSPRATYTREQSIITVLRTFEYAGGASAQPTPTPAPTQNPTQNPASTPIDLSSAYSYITGDWKAEWGSNLSTNYYHFKPSGEFISYHISFQTDFSGRATGVKSGSTIHIGSFWIEQTREGSNEYNIMYNRRDSHFNPDAGVDSTYGNAFYSRLSSMTYNDVHSSWNPPTGMERVDSLHDVIAQYFSWLDSSGSAPTPQPTPDPPGGTSNENIVMYTESREIPSFGRMFGITSERDHRTTQVPQTGARIDTYLYLYRNLNPSVAEDYWTRYIDALLSLGFSFDHKVDDSLTLGGDSYYYRKGSTRVLVGINNISTIRGIETSITITFSI